ncbi:MAG: tetratricopeptide repeat protein [Planctomycetota bacterium]|nr:MAG: tetratricopeptide repeat protein [Planctomycetota bacterium]
MKHSWRSIVVSLALLCVAACSGPAPLPGQPGFHADLVGTHREIDTQSKVAQRYFDQGLTLTFGFSHDEAIRCFRAAAEADPTAPLPWWGIALCLGPHINNPAMSEQNSRDARAAWEKADALARARADGCAGEELETALIAALGARYAAEPPADRRPLDEAYAAAMEKLFVAHRRDADIGVLFAESLMDLQPWDLWTRAGQPKGRAKDIVSVLDEVLSFAPRHPGALHLLVHAMEASSHPEHALFAADRLRDLVPGIGHLVHMPAHIDARLGRWAEASACNERAIVADRKLLERFPVAGFTRIYFAHNHHFLMWSEMMRGRSKVALEQARETADSFPGGLRESLADFVDGVLPAEMHVNVRFGRWNDVLAAPAFPDPFPIANTLRHYARGIALVALGRLDDARAEQREFEAWAARVPEKRQVGNSKSADVIALARGMLAGELAIRAGQLSNDAKLLAEGLASLRSAAAIEDTLQYDEPPDWLMPVRHALGAALLEEKQWGEAVEVFRADLERNPENGWALFGLARALRESGDAAGAFSAQTRFEKAWKDADVKLTSSCFCQPGR